MLQFIIFATETAKQLCAKMTVCTV